MQAILKSDPAAFKFVRKFWTDYKYRGAAVRNWNKLVTDDHTWKHRKKIFNLLVNEFIKHGRHGMGLAQYINKTKRLFEKVGASRILERSGLYSYWKDEAFRRPIAHRKIVELKNAFKAENCGKPHLMFTSHKFSGGRHCCLSEIRVSFDLDDNIIDTPMYTCYKCYKRCSRKSVCGFGGGMTLRAKLKTRTQSNKVVSERHVVAVLSHAQRLASGV